MCSFPTLWHQDERFRESYLNEFPGYYKTTDVGFKDDDIINVAGHRLSTGGIEEVLSAHKQGRGGMCGDWHCRYAQG